MNSSNHTRTNGIAQKAVVIWIVVLLAIAAGAYGLVKLGGGMDGTTTAVEKVSANDHTIGPMDAPAVLIEYSDFQCPACAAYYSIMKQLGADAALKDKLLIAYRHYPLTQIHKHSEEAALASEAAAKQGRFWEMHDKLFENQDQWASLSNVQDTFAGYARSVGLDETKFLSDYASQSVKDAVQKDIDSGNSAKVTYTPTFFLNGKKISNPRTYDDFKKLVQDAINGNVNASTSVEAVHLHANLRVVVNGTVIDFSQPTFQESKDHPLSEAAHFHNHNGEVVHVHASDVKLNDLLTSFGMNITQDCLKLDSGETKCATGANKLRMVVNAKENTDFGSYVFQDLDRILVIYGTFTDAQVNAEIAAVPDTACIYSDTCPERGSPPEEECVGGVGTNCN